MSSAPSPCFPTRSRRCSGVTDWTRSPSVPRRSGCQAVTRLARWFGLNTWLITGCDEVKAVLGGAGAFSSDFTRLAQSTGLDAGHPGCLGFSDPPRHTRLRRLLTPVFTARRLSASPRGVTRSSRDSSTRWNGHHNLSAHTNWRTKRRAAKNKVELCFTPTYASWANPIEAHFGPLRQFTLANSNHPNHTVQTRAPARLPALPQPERPPPRRPRGPTT